MEPAAHSRIFGPSIPVKPGARLTWCGIAVACAAILGTAIYLKPDERGHGTHQQIGLGPCSWIIVSGLPCPTCGMTTSFSLLMHGRPLDALRAQPAGAVMCIGTIAMFLLSVYVVVSGRVVSINWYRVGPVRLMVGLGLLILGGWAFKIALGLITGELPAR